jgi:hypothetical protein
VAAIKMTLRERQRISVAYEEPSGTVVDVPAQAGGGAAPQPIPMPPPASLAAAQPRRRWWRLWHREAA